MKSAGKVSNLVTRKRETALVADRAMNLLRQRSELRKLAMPSRQAPKVVLTLQYLQAYLQFRPAGRRVAAK
jgi:hypothetical protein